MWLDALIRILDGQPREDAYTELFIELGDSPAAARRKVREAEANAARGDAAWRRLLD